MLLCFSAFSINFLTLLLLWPLFSLPFLFSFLLSRSRNSLSFFSDSGKASSTSFDSQVHRVFIHRQLIACDDPNSLAYILCTCIMPHRSSCTYDREGKILLFSMKIGCRSTTAHTAVENWIERSTELWEPVGGLGGGWLAVGSFMLHWAESKFDIAHEKTRSGLRVADGWFVMR